VKIVRQQKPKHYSEFVKANPRFLKVFRRVKKLTDPKAYWLFRVLEIVFLGSNNWEEYSNSGTSVTWSDGHGLYAHDPVLSGVEWVPENEQDLSGFEAKLDPTPVQDNQDLSGVEWMPLNEQNLSAFEAKLDPTPVQDNQDHVEGQSKGQDDASVAESHSRSKTLPLSEHEHADDLDLSTLPLDEWPEEQDLSGFEAVVEETFVETQEQTADDNIDVPDGVEETFVETQEQTADDNTDLSDDPKDGTTICASTDTSDDWVEQQDLAGFEPAVADEPDA